MGNMSIDRELNPSLGEYKLVQRQPNWIEYIKKGSGEIDYDSMDRKIMETFEDLKKYY